MRAKLSTPRLLRLILNFLKKTLYLQVVATSVSLPFLAAHGLSISLLTVVGNLFFMPFLLSFMVVSAVVFFFEVVGVSTVFFHVLLQKIALYWYKILVLAPPSLQIILSLNQAVTISFLTLLSLFLIKSKWLFVFLDEIKKKKEGLMKTLPFID